MKKIFLLLVCMWLGSSVTYSEFIRNPVVTMKMINDSPEKYCTVGENGEYQTIKDAMLAMTDVSKEIVIIDEKHTEYDIVISKEITIRGVGKRKKVIQAQRNGNKKSRRVFWVKPSGNLNLENLIICNGFINKQPRAGAGIYNEGRATLNNCTVTNNTATYGVGVFSVGELEIDNSSISKNSYILRSPEEEVNGVGCAGSGGGIKIQRGTGIITHTLISSNVANRSGGGIKVSCKAGVKINKCLIINNTSGNFGGGISLNGKGILSENIIINNKSTKGGGLHLVGDLSFEKNLFFNNTLYDFFIMTNNTKFKPTVIKNTSNFIPTSHPKVLK